MAAVSACFQIGDSVYVRKAFPPGHIRTPYYIRGKKGIVADVLAAFPNPEDRAKGEDGDPVQPLYRVRFLQTVAWGNYDGSPEDTLDIEIFQHWLEPT